MEGAFSFKSGMDIRGSLFWTIDTSTQAQKTGKLTSQSIINIVYRREKTQQIK